ncbi:MAG: site-specific integrase [Proteobacteria bacterium]|nr:site-specific integrase [Pseudomonadota bacterium]
MARTVRNAKIDSRSARARLPASKMPHWTALSRGCALGYRKGPKGGVWLAKVVRGEFRREVTLGPSDDTLDADGAIILNHAQAQARARDWITAQLREADGHGSSGGTGTLGDALKEYMADYKRRGGKSAADAQSRIDALILPPLGDLKLGQLTARRIRAWHAELAEKAARLRTRKGGKQQYRDAQRDPDAGRKRQATANRTLTILKAALNHAFQEGRVGTDEPWRRVRPFREADAAKVRYLSADECRRLVNASDADLRALVQGALLTGCRYGELAALRCSEFNADSGTVTVRVSKSGKPRHVVLNDDGLSFFASAAAGKAGDALIFTRANGEPWGRSHQHRPLRDACQRAKIAPAASFHVLRHTYASHLVQAGAPLPVIAANLGHTDTRMTERHYAHLSSSHIADVIRATMPSLGIVAPSRVARLAVGRKAAKVVPLRKRR